MGTLFSTINCFDNTQFCKSKFGPLFFSEHALRGARCVFYCFFFRKITPNHLQNKMHISFILEGGLHGSCHMSGSIEACRCWLHFSCVLVSQSRAPTDLLSAPMTIKKIIYAVHNRRCASVKRYNHRITEFENIVMRIGLKIHGGK